MKIKAMRILNWKYRRGLASVKMSTKVEAYLRGKGCAILKLCNLTDMDKLMKSYQAKKLLRRCECIYDYLNQFEYLQGSAMNDHKAFRLETATEVANAGISFFLLLISSYRVETKWRQFGRDIGE